MAFDKAGLQEKRFAQCIRYAADFFQPQDDMPRLTGHMQR